MTRYKWYCLGLPGSLFDFIGRIKARNFSANSASGFIAGEDDLESYAFRYAWRSRIVATDIDAEGNSTASSISIVNVCEFSIFSKFDKIWLRIVDPPRSNKELLDALETVAGFGFYAEIVIFSSSVHAALLKSVDECRLISFKGVGGIPEEKAVARIEMASKIGLDLNRFEFLKKIQYSVDHAVYEAVYRRERGQIAFSTSGLVKIGGDLRPYMLELVESELPRKRD